MSLTRYLPTPSDRMGILWSLLQIEDAVILEYGTAGTTTLAMNILGGNTVGAGQKLFTTQMGEDDVVMGDTTRLENAVRLLDKTRAPQVIFVMASSVASVTGADVKGVCAYLQSEINAQLVVFPQGGFSGDFSSGLQAVYTTLVEKLVVNKHESKACFNILGVSAKTNHAHSDVAEIERIMQSYFGLSAHAVLCLETSLQALQSMSQARVNVVLSSEGLAAAQILEERFGTPYVQGLPVGRRGTVQWLDDIAEALGTSSAHGHANLSSQTSAFQVKPGAKIAAYASYDELIALQKFVNQEGIPVEFLLCTHKPGKGMDAQVAYLKSEADKIKLFESLSGCYVWGDAMFARHLDKSNRHFESCFQQRKISSEVPTLLGETGLVSLKQWLTC